MEQKTTRHASYFIPSFLVSWPRWSFLKVDQKSVSEGGFRWEDRFYSVYFWNTSRYSWTTYGYVTRMPAKTRDVRMHNAELVMVCRVFSIFDSSNNIHTLERD